MGTKVATGIVVDGKVFVEGEALTERSTVTVVLRADADALDLKPEEEESMEPRVSSSPVSPALSTSGAIQQAY